ncbi:hypothetical protein BFJ63_vAg16130 [Fusarium oxysporum f. sp. narcissi]|uniref:Uncharacterized protein n=1 Tax=Fusarium oxysporum f. sp. narcissi TaxID=451672 RepID=A0A4Q2V9Y7_FUSOX|nr:hypothetical protein BFJ63_vAg16130 [Fusarium oxysporum f. sp. narcissi]
MGRGSRVCNRDSVLRLSISPGKNCPSPRRILSVLGNKEVVTIAGRPSTSGLDGSRPIRSRGERGGSVEDFDHASCRPSDAESMSESLEAESGSPFGARVSPPSQELPFRRRSRRRSSHAHDMVHDKDGDVDTRGTGSEDRLDVPDSVF